MSAAHHSRTRSMTPLHGNGSSTEDDNAVVQVKIKNLNKGTTRGHLKSKLHQFKVIDVKLIICRNREVNYAYIHLPDFEVAERLVKAVHNRMEIHSNLLKAVLMEGTYIRHANGPVSVRSQPQTKQIDLDKNLVQLLIYDKDASVTEPQLKIHFMKYGEVDSIVPVHEDFPRSTEIHYTNTVSAHAARYDSPHAICQASVVALPLPRGDKFESTITTKEYPCDPLVITEAMKILPQNLQQGPQLRVIARKNTIVVHQVRGSSDYEHKILHTIRTFESKIGNIKMELEFHWLPILADEDVQKQFGAFKEPCDIKIYHKTEEVSLLQLSQDYSSNRFSDSACTAAFRKYLGASTAASSKIKYQWFWQDDDKLYKPYTEEVNKRVERAFTDKLQSPCLQEIGKFFYIINCTTMTQTNASTGKSRPLKRQQIDSDEILVFTLKLRAHESHLQHFKKAVLNALGRFSTEAKIEVPKAAMPTTAFQDVIGKWKKKNTIKVTLDKDESAAVVSLQGKPILVRTAEAELHKVILKVVAETSFHVTLPNSWEPQTKKCELKSVRRGTTEWTDIQELMSKPECGIRISKIERIQNTWLWELYQLSKKRMSEKNNGEVNEKLLFHGTKQTSPKDIYDSEQGFDNRLASQGLWGEGTYFAATAKYSHTYAHAVDKGHKQMFLAQVITGTSCKFSSPDQSLKAPPKKEDRRGLLASLFWSNTSKFEGERYDSVTATANGSKIYVIYELGRVYPAYLITYIKV